MRILFLFVLIFPSFAFTAAFLNSSDDAFKKAKTSNRPLLIDFFGEWCPPCNALDENVFATSEFEKSARDFVLVKINADRKESWKIKHRYKVGGYPTVIFASPSGDELFRLTGYRDLKSFLKLMATARALKNLPLTKACQSAEVENRLRCARVSVEKEDFATAEKIYKGLEKELAKRPWDNEEARGFFVANESNFDLKRSGFENLLVTFPSSPHTLNWSIDYLEMFEKNPNSGSKPKPELIEKIISQIETIRKDPHLADVGYEISDVLSWKALIYNKLGEGTKSKAAWKELATLYQNELAHLPKGNSGRAIALEAIHTLERAGESAEALKLADRYIEKYPREFSFHYLKAGLLDRMKNYDAAEKSARKAYEFGYGDNRIRAATLLVTMLGYLERIDKAKEVYEAVKAEFAPSPNLDIRTPRYLKQLDEAWIWTKK